MQSGTIAIALLQHQIVLVQATRSRPRSDRWVEVQTFSPFGAGLFMQTATPSRIKASSILRIVDVPSTSYCQCFTDSTLSLDHVHTSRGLYSMPHFNDSDCESTLDAASDIDPEILEVSPRAYGEFLAMSEKHAKKNEPLWKRLYSRRR